MNYYVFGGTEIKNYIHNYNNIINTDNILVYSGNTYIYKKIIEFVQKNKITSNDVFLIGWTDSTIQCGYNDILKYITFGLSIPTTIYKDYRYYNLKEQQFDLNFFRKNLFIQLDNYCKQYINIFKKDILYDMTIKYMYIIFTHIFLTNNNIKYYFLDILPNKYNPSIEDLLTMLNKRQDKYEFDGIINQYNILKKQNTNWLTYDTNINYIIKNIEE